MKNLMKFLQKLFAEKNNLQVNIKTEYRSMKKVIITQKYGEK